MPPKTRSAYGPAKLTAIPGHRLPTSHMSEVSTYAIGPNQYQPTPTTGTSRPKCLVVKACPASWMMIAIMVAGTQNNSSHPPNNGAPLQNPAGSRGHQLPPAGQGKAVLGFVVELHALYKARIGQPFYYLAYSLRRERSELLE